MRLRARTGGRSRPPTEGKSAALRIHGLEPRKARQSRATSDADHDVTPGQQPHSGPCSSPNSHKMSHTRQHPSAALTPLTDWNNAHRTHGLHRPNLTTDSTHPAHPRGASMVATRPYAFRDLSQEDHGLSWVVTPAPAPTAHKDSKVLTSATLPGSPRDFYDAALADSATFLEDFMEGAGERRVNLSNWKRHDQLGRVRDLQFTSPVKGAFGGWGGQPRAVLPVAAVSSAPGLRLFSLYQEDHLVFESSQTITGIPYADCFKIDVRWDITVDVSSPTDQPSVLFKVSLHVPFTRACLFKKVIEIGTHRQMQESYSSFLEQLRPVMDRRSLAVRSSLAHRGARLELQEPLQTHHSRNASAGFGYQLSQAGSLNAPPGSPLPHMPQFERSPSRNDLPRASFTSKFAELALNSVGSSNAASRSQPPATLWRSLEFAGAAFTGLVEGGVKLALGASQTRVTRATLLLTAAVALLFLMQCCTLVLLFSDGRGASGGTGSGGSGSGSSSGGGGGSVGGGAASCFGQDPMSSDVSQVGGGVGVGLAEGVGAQCGALMSGVRAAGGDVYWAGRLSLLQQEVGLLASRMELVSAEIRSVAAQLMSASEPTPGGVP
ncbi:MAG: hypothetical protein WDW38_002830 [Sanguina aurantia]